MERIRTTFLTVRKSDSDVTVQEFKHGDRQRLVGGGGGGGGGGGVYESCGN